MDGLTIREPTAPEYVAGARLLATSLGFGLAEAIPGWLMHATTAEGGVTLAAYDRAQRLVGWSYAFVGVSAAGPHLFSCGLAVAPAQRSEGVGRALKLAQRSAALQHGLRFIRWTADPLSAPALRLYLTGLGARVTAYRAGLYDALRSAGDLPQDDVEVEWRIDGAGARGPGRPARRIELPFERRSLSGEEHLAWRLRVRAGLREPLEAGWTGVGVELDRRARRCWLELEAPAR